MGKVQLAHLCTAESHYIISRTARYLQVHPSHRLHGMAFVDAQDRPPAGQILISCHLQLQGNGLEGLHVCIMSVGTPSWM